MSGQTQIKRVVQVGTAPELSAFFQSDQNVGTIVVLAGEDGVDVFVDGKKFRNPTSRGGQLRIQRAPKEYHVRVAKQGFQERRNRPSRSPRERRRSWCSSSFLCLQRPT